ncbi:hypothetical protein HU200_019970 [Digitaria exilis]|uniref:Exocyst complex component Sec10 n=1 Tax=Digitaria exilis TaxID=1010633 RepID=A0A835KCR9_9POAL|nr:hypothetical protein HU200_019970 [Digitaria exilis]
MPTAADPAAALPLTLDLEDFKVSLSSLRLLPFRFWPSPPRRVLTRASRAVQGDFSFDALFGGLVDELLPEYRGEDDAAPAPPPPPPVLGAAPPVFPAVDELLGLFKHSCKELVDLRRQIDKRLQNLKKEVAVQDTKHRKTLGELEKGVDGLFDSFARLDSRISSVGQTAAKIGDHLQSAESQRETASQTIDLIKYLMEFNSTPGDLMELSPLFSDDSRVAEAASIAQKLRSFAEEDVGRHGVASAVGSANASRGLEVAVANLQEYCNGQFASFQHFYRAFVPLLILRFNRGTSAMQHYVATRPMFIDVEIMNTDIQVVLGDEGLQADSSYIADGLSTLYKEIADTVRKEATTITAVFPSPNEVMAILVQDLQSIGCGDLDIEGLIESIYVAHKDEYTEFEQASLRQLYQAKMAELKAEAKQHSESTGSIGRAKGASLTTSPQQLISVTVVTEFVRWNEEAIARCTLLFSQPTTVAANVRSIFACLLDQVSQYLTEGIDRARDSLNEAANMRERYSIGSSVSRRVAQAAANAAEAAATAGESSFRSFMIAVQRCASSVAILQQYFSNTISRLLLPVDGAHPSACEDMGSAVSVVEAAAHKGLLQCIDTVMSEVERLLSSEQKATDYRTPDDGAAPDHRPTNACIRIVAYLSRVLEVAFNALEGLNKQSFLTELVFVLLTLWFAFWIAVLPWIFVVGDESVHAMVRFSGGLRLKRDITEYGDFVRSFNAPSIDEKFELLGIVANVFIVAPESLASLFEGTPSIRKDALRFIQLRDDYKTAKIASMLNNITAE